MVLAVGVRYCWRSAPGGVFRANGPSVIIARYGRTGRAAGNYPATLSPICGVATPLDNRSMRRSEFENMATALVDPAVLEDLELALMALDFRVWTVRNVSTFADAPQAAFQIRRNLIDWSNGRWEVAANWTLIWITFGDSWLDGDNPIPWPAHEALWNKLAEYSDHVRYNLGLGGVPRLGVPRETR